MNLVDPRLADAGYANAVRFTPRGKLGYAQSVESHCARCLTPAPDVEDGSRSPREWEALDADGLVIVCPNCMTPEELEVLDDGRC